MMNQFSSSKHKQRERVVAQFMNFTQSNEKNAVNFLAQHDWKLDLAVDAYFLSMDSGLNRGQHNMGRHNSNSSSVDRKKLDQIWSSYKGRKNLIWFQKIFLERKKKFLFVFQEGDLIMVLVGVISQAKYKLVNQGNWPYLSKITWEMSSLFPSTFEIFGNLSSLKNLS